MKVLVVDDNTEFCDNMKDILELQGYNTTCVYSGKTALKEIEKDGFMIALVDIAMPEMDGITLLKKIKEIEPGLPVTLITGFAQEHSAGEARREGALTLLKKPIDFDELAKILGSVK